MRLAKNTWVSRHFGKYIDLWRDSHGNTAILRDVDIPNVSTNGRHANDAHELPTGLRIERHRNRVASDRKAPNGSSHAPAIRRQPSCAIPPLAAVPRHFILLKDDALILRLADKVQVFRVARHNKLAVIVRDLEAKCHRYLVRIIIMAGRLPVTTTVAYPLTLSTTTTGAWPPVVGDGIPANATVQKASLPTIDGMW